METTPPKNKGGRPVGSLAKVTKESREKAKQTGMLPHEFLLAIAQGQAIEHKVIDPETGNILTTYITPDFDKRTDAAKAAAPYYAPKISTVEVITGVSNDDLDAIIAGAAAEAGISLGFDGEGPEDEAEEGTGTASSPVPSAPASRERRRAPDA